VHQYDAASRITEVLRCPAREACQLPPANELEGRYALAWALNIWADMLAV
jgi:hypothetical protein